jgi:hypothetical protein
MHSDASGTFHGLCCGNYSAAIIANDGFLNGHTSILGHQRLHSASYIQAQNHSTRYFTATTTRIAAKDEKK